MVRLVVVGILTIVLMACQKSSLSVVVEPTDLELLRRQWEYNHAVTKQEHELARELYRIGQHYAMQIAFDDLCQGVFRDIERAYPEPGSPTDDDVRRLYHFMFGPFLVETEPYESWFRGTSLVKVSVEDIDLALSFCKKVIQ